MQKVQIRSDLNSFPIGKMVSISQTTYSDAFSWIKILYFDSNFIDVCSIDCTAALIQVMACRRRGNKPLPEPMLTQFTDAYMWH